MKMPLPTGFNPVAAGQFLAGAHNGLHVDAFAMKATPVTNQEYGEVCLNQFILLDHNWNTGENQLKKSGMSIKEVVGGPAFLPEGINFDKGNIFVLGSTILLKMVENPSAQYDMKKRVFSGANQPAVGITYFHAKVWCLLKMLESGGEFVYDLPTDVQYEYVASDRGTKEYGTETGTLFKGGRKLAHIDESSRITGHPTGATVAVDDPRYEQALPFGVQTTGNIWRWIRFNPEFKRPNDYFIRPYGLRGGSWGSREISGRAAFRSYNLTDVPGHRLNDIGFSPVVVRQDSRK
jgi:formylglycine-generating enzyme required for sulfatase activity